MPLSFATWAVALTVPIYITAGLAYALAGRYSMGAVMALYGVANAVLAVEGLR